MVLLRNIWHWCVGSRAWQVPASIGVDVILHTMFPMTYVRLLWIEWVNARPWKLLWRLFG